MLLNSLFFLLVYAYVTYIVLSFKGKNWAWLQAVLLLGACVAVKLMLPPDQALYILLGILVVFNLIPSSILAISNKLAHKGSFRHSVWLMRIVGVLWPLSGYFAMAQYYRAVYAIEQGRSEEGAALLKSLAESRHPMARLSEISMHNLLQDFGWVVENFGPQELDKFPAMMDNRMNALGQVGQVNRLVEEMFERKEKLSPRNKPAEANALLSLAMFTGQEKLWTMISPLVWPNFPAFGRKLRETMFRYICSGDEQAFLAELDRLAETAPPMFAPRIAYQQRNLKIGCLKEPLTEENQQKLDELTTYFERYFEFIGANNHHVPETRGIKAAGHRLLRFFDISDWKNTPFVTLILIFVNLYAFIWMQQSGRPITEQYYQAGALFYPYSFMQGDWSRLITYCFAHANWEHLGFNMFALAMVSLVERKMGHWRYLLIYTACGLGSVLGSLAIASCFHVNDHPAIVLGASGAIFGMFGCLMGIAYKAWKHDGLSVGRRLVLSVTLSVVLQSAFDICFLGTSVWIHLSGFLLGLTLFFLLDLYEIRNRTLVRQKLSLVGLAWMAFLLFATGKLIYDYAHPKPLDSLATLQHGQIAEIAGFPKEAMKLYLKSADSGNMMAQMLVAWHYAKGDIVPSDWSNAFHWAKKAAEQGDASSQSQVGCMYEAGQGTSKDLKAALYWFQKAASQNNTLAEDHLGYLYATGQGVSQDKEAAYSWFVRAAKQGDAWAQRQLGLVYWYGDGVQRDIEQAMAWYQKAAKQNDLYSQYFLATAYYYGPHGTPDYSASYYWSFKALMHPDLLRDGKNVKYVKKLAKFNREALLHLPRQEAWKMQNLVIAETQRERKPH